MNSFPEVDRRLRLPSLPSGCALPPASLSSGAKSVPVVAVMGNRAFVRAWMVRRAQRAVSASGSLGLR